MSMKKRFGFTLHNLVGHPVSEIAWIFGFEGLSKRIHDATLPRDADRL